MKAEVMTLIARSRVWQDLLSPASLQFILSKYFFSLVLSFPVFPFFFSSLSKDFRLQFQVVFFFFLFFQILPSFFIIIFFFSPLQLQKTAINHNLKYNDIFHIINIILTKVFFVLINTK